MNKDRHKIGSRIGAVRKAAGLSQRQVAELLGIPTRTFSHYEGPKGDLPSSLLAPLADILDVDCRVLIGTYPTEAVVRRRTSSRSSLIRKAEAVRQLPQGEQEFVLKFLNQVLEDYQRRRCNPTC